MTAVKNQKIQTASATALRIFFEIIDRDRDRAVYFYKIFDRERDRAVYLCEEKNLKFMFFKIFDYIFLLLHK